MKVHLFAAICVFLCTLFLDLSRMEIVFLVFSISLVVICEMINTAIEKTVDIFTEEYHPLAKIAKDVAAGAVLISAINAIIIGYLVFFRQIMPVSQRVLDRIKQTPVHIIFICILIILVIVVLFKLRLNTPNIVQGGMPSGHAAVAFSLVTAIFLLSKNTLTGFLALLIGILVVQSRVEGKIHSIIEVLIGATLGIGITIILFKLLSFV
jgi:diacylglycerol kinase (ATP)